MNSNLKNYLKRLDAHVDLVRKQTRTFRESFDLTCFAYVRVYHDGRIGWLTADSDHDRLLVDSGSIDQDPLIDTAQALQKGHYLWFHDREFPGCDSFYKARARHFKMDHGMVVVQHQKEYLETACFSGYLAKRPLYNLFLKELPLFKAFFNYFTKTLPSSFTSVLEQGLHLSDLKASYGKVPHTCLEEKEAFLSAYGYGPFLRLSKREKECLALLLKGFTYQMIGHYLKLSPRTVEAYLNSVKNKLGLETQTELIQVAHQMANLALLPVFE